jgi:hypothetical protein
MFEMEAVRMNVAVGRREGNSVLSSCHMSGTIFY